VNVIEMPMTKFLDELERGLVRVAPMDVER